MCLITISYQQNPQYPFILVANRDEFFLRPSAPMHFWQAQPELLAGQDLDHKGTWLGITQAGRFAALTNYRSGPKTDQSFAFSRGVLVTNTLLNGLHLSTEQLYAPFNLIYADRRGLFYTNNQGLSEPQPLAAGLYGLCNAALDTPWPKVVDAKQQLAQVADQQNISMCQLKNLMTATEIAAEHDLPDTGISKTWESALSSQFIKINDEYGTRAKTIILQERSGRTQICEMRYDQTGFIGESNFQINVPVMGSD